MSPTGIRRALQVAAAVEVTVIDIMFDLAMRTVARICTRVRHSDPTIGR